MLTSPGSICVCMCKAWRRHVGGLQEVQHPSGKTEKVYRDGRRTVIFANGTRKDQFPDGHTTIRFTNRDIKRFFSDGVCSQCLSQSIRCWVLVIWLRFVKQCQITLSGQAAPSCSLFYKAKCTSPCSACMHMLPPSYGVESAPE